MLVKFNKEKKNNEEMLSKLGEGVNEKLKYLIELLYNHYENDQSFYLQRHEYAFLSNLIIKEKF